MPGEIFSTGASFCAEGRNVMTRGDTWTRVTLGQLSRGGFREQNMFPG